MVDEKTIIESEVADNRLAVMLQNYLEKDKSRMRLKNLRLCGSRVIHNEHWVPSVFVMYNGKNAHLFGNSFCHNPWACPRCAPQVMAKYGNRIACAIDALQKWHNQVAIMITFTLPHIKSMSADDAFTILRNTWHAFVKGGMQKGRIRHYTTKKTGEHKIYHVGDNAYGKFREQLGIKHNVRVYEFTYGEEFGWHPHIHALYWVPRKNLDKVLDYEQQLMDLWWNHAKNQAAKFFKKSYPNDPDKVKEIINSIYNDRKKQSKEHKTLYISLDEHGKPRIQKSSHYIAGWNANAEMTSRGKTANNGHMTPRQILEKAHDEPEHRDELLKLYVEYANAVRNHKRFQFSKTGMNELINKWKLTEAYYETLKKKAMDAGTEPFRIIVWFTEKQWLEIFTLNKTHHLIPKILAMAHQPNGKELIERLLLEFGIDITKNDKHPFKSFIEKCLFGRKHFDDDAA